MNRIVGFDGHTLTVDDCWDVAVDQHACRLEPVAVERMAESRACIEKLAGQDRAIYGVNTGFGPLSGSRVSGADLEQHQINLLHHLSVGQGELLNEPETRAVMVARTNALARGYSGIRPEVVDILIQYLNRGVLPLIPSEGSVGASGDLVPLAHMARSIVGLGDVLFEGRRVRATEALKTLNLEPAILQAKEGLALVNGTSGMTGLAVLSVHEASRALRWAEMLTAFLVEVSEGEPEAFCARVQRARAHRGQSTASEGIVHHLRTNERYSQLIDIHSWGTAPKTIEPGVDVQDPYSLRCAPQILGAIQDSLWHVDSVVTRELNATTDNPLVFADEEIVIHCGNFYGQHVSMVMDYLRLGLAKLGLTIERQLDRLVNVRYSKGLPPMLAGGAPGLNTGMAGAQLLATSLAAELRLLCGAASVQTIPTNANNQDVVSMGMISSKLTRQALPKLWKLIAIQAMALAQASDLRGNGAGESYCRLKERVREISPQLAEDRPLFEEIEAMTAFVSDPKTADELLHPAAKKPEE